MQKPSMYKRFFNHYRTQSLRIKVQMLMGKTTTNNIPENAADIISPNLQESMRSNNQRVAIINHQKHK